MIRNTIIDLYKRNGAPLPLDLVANQLGKSTQALSGELATQQRLDELYGLTPEQAVELIEFYGARVLFADVLEDVVRKAVSGRAKLKRIDSKKRSGGKPPPPQGS